MGKNSPKCTARDLTHLLICSAYIPSQSGAAPAALRSIDVSHDGLGTGLDLELLPLMVAGISVAAADPPSISGSAAILLDYDAGRTLL